MKRHLTQLFAILTLLLLTSCSNEIGSGTGLVPISSTPTSNSPSSAQATPTIHQQHLPKGLLNPKYPVMDWVFNQTCSRSVASYNLNPMDATIAYDSAAWLYPSDGHLIEGFQDCDKNALIYQARNHNLPTLLTVGIDASWPPQDSARYIDQASSQPQQPCTPDATTYICMIVNWATAGGYAGVIVDFELVQWNYPNIRQKFGTFMHKLQEALHQKGLFCGVALVYKFGDTPQEDSSFKLNYFQDWNLLSTLDFLVAMVLDFDLADNKPGPITSMPWLAKQLDYLWKTMPQALSKTIFELPFYGREWQKNDNGHWSVVSDEICQQVNAQKASQSLLPDVSTDPTTPEIAWNDQNGHRHEVWYSTTSSLVAIMTQLQEKVRALLNDPHYKLPLSFWYRGAECASFFGPGNALAAFYNN